MCFSIVIIWLVPPTLPHIIRLRGGGAYPPFTPPLCSPLRLWPCSWYNCRRRRGRLLGYPRCLTNTHHRSRYRAQLRSKTNRFRFRIQHYRKTGQWPEINPAKIRIRVSGSDTSENTESGSDPAETSWPEPLSDSGQIHNRIRPKYPILDPQLCVTGNIFLYMFWPNMFIMKSCTRVKENRSFHKESDLWLLSL